MTIREKSLVRVKGESEVYRVEYIGVALGHHYREAHLRLARDAMVQPVRLMDVRHLEPAPVDLEDFPGC